MRKIEKPSSSKTKLKCKLCDYEIESKELAEFMKHIKQTHGMNSYTQWRIEKSEVLPLQCTFCEFCFKTENVLIKHRTAL